MMDTEFARSFLTIVASGSFIEAARRLHLTASTGSAPIRRLEQQPGKELFARLPGGDELTGAGHRFQHHASLMTRIVAQARQEIVGATNIDAVLSISGRRLALLCAAREPHCNHGPVLAECLGNRRPRGAAGSKAVRRDPRPSQ